MEKHVRKKFVNMISLSVLYMLIKKEENLRLTICKTEILCQWAPKVVLDVQFFSVPNRHVSPNYKPKFLGMWS